MPQRFYRLPPKNCTEQTSACIYSSSADGLFQETDFVINLPWVHKKQNEHTNLLFTMKLFAILASILALVVATGAQDDNVCADPITAGTKEEAM